MARVLRRIVAEKESIMWKRLETTRFSNFEDLLLTKQSIWSYLFLRHGSVLALMLNVLAIQNFLCLAKSPLCQICAPGEVNNDSKPIHSMSSMFGMSVWLPAIDFVKQSSIACDLCLHVAILGIRQLRHTFFTNLKIGGCAKVTTCPMVCLTRGIWTHFPKRQSFRGPPLLWRRPGRCPLSLAPRPRELLAQNKLEKSPTHGHQMTSMVKNISEIYGNPGRGPASFGARCLPHSNLHQLMPAHYLKKKAKGLGPVRSNQTRATDTNKIAEMLKRPKASPLLPCPHSHASHPTVDPPPGRTTRCPLCGDFDASPSTAQLEVLTGNPNLSSRLFGRPLHHPGADEPGCLRPILYPPCKCDENYQFIVKDNKLALTASGADMLCCMSKNLNSELPVDHAPPDLMPQFC
jgi:hypothetical protein